MSREGVLCCIMLHICRIRIVLKWQTEENSDGHDLLEGYLCRYIRELSVYAVFDV